MSGKRGPKFKLTDSARKRHKRDLNAKLSKSRIYIGDQIDRWTDLKTNLSVESNADLAKILLDSFEERNDKKSVDLSMDSHFAPPETSTPAPSKTCTVVRDHFVAEPESEISNIAADEVMEIEGGEISGVEDIELATARSTNQCLYSNSFLDPFDLTIYSSELTDDEDKEDEEYEPSFHVSLRLDHDIPLSVSDEEEEEEGEEDQYCQEQEIELGHGIKRLRSNDEIDFLLEDHPALVFTKQLLELARTKVNYKCKVKGCSEEVNVTLHTVSSAIYLKWMCTNAHIAHQWCSQPLLNRGLHSGDVLISAGLLASGNNFQKLALFAKFLKLPFPSSSSFWKIQRTYVLPSIDEIWESHQNEILDEFRGKDLILLGDGRMDSPGHSAQFCTYTFMEHDTHKILCVVTLDKRITGRKSAVLEKACFQRGLRFLLQKNMKIVEIVTDAHVQIQALMKNEYPQIKHSFDIWHGSKNLGKKIIQAGQEKSKRPLLSWTREVVNHFWYCSSTAKTEGEFIGMWLGVIHHVINEHEWILPYRLGAQSSCMHGPLMEEREGGWLEAGSPAHVALRDIVRDKRLLKKIPYYLNCRSTAALENFQNLILKYSSKQHSYTPPVYKARNLIAALDHNSNCRREILRKKDGSQRHQRYYSKKSGRWSTYGVKSE